MRPCAPQLCLALLHGGNTHSGDVYYEGEYGGIDVSPLETVFFKVIVCDVM